jgi:hypothetical protein
MLYIAQKSSAFSPRMELPATQAKSANQGRMKFAGKRPIPPIQANEIRGYTGKVRLRGLKKKPPIKGE